MKNNKLNLLFLLQFAGGVVLLLISLLAHALSSTSVTVRVMIRTSPCVVNNNQPINVDFGKVAPSRIDSGHYKITVPYTLNCAQAENNALLLRIQGAAAKFDTNALQTSQDALGIAFLANGESLAVNDRVNFTNPRIPVLEAVLVRDSEIELNAGEFSAAATLRIEYQ